MKYRKKALGFTIIEIMLFLAITSVLTAGLFVGVGTSINSQRYHDSVNSLRSIIQEQYSNVANVSNSRSQKWKCSDIDGIQEGLGGEFVGQSDCVVIGKLITTDASNDSALMIKTIVGYPINEASYFSSNDLVTLKDRYKLKISPIKAQTEEYSMEWDNYLTEQSGKSASNFSIFIFRSPSTGSIKTLINSKKVVDNIYDLVNSTSLAEGLSMCVNARGFVTGEKMSVVLNPNASNANDIETKGSDSGCK